MKRKIVYLEAVLLSLAAAWAVVGCLVTAFELPAVLDERIAAVWCAACVAGMVLFSLRKGGTLVLLLLFFGIAGGWNHTELPQQLRNVLGWIAKVYDEAYGWGIPPMLRDPRGGGELALMLLGILIVESVVCAVLHRKGSPLAVALLTVPLAACLVVTDTVPESSCLYVLLLCLLMLLLTDGVRAEGGNQGTRLTLGALLPTALALGLLFWFFPREQYADTTQELRMQILSCAQDITERVQSGQLGLPNYSRQRDRVDLASLSSQPQLGLPVAEISADFTGPVYLRVQDFDVYTGTDWVSTPSRQETLSGTGDSVGTVVVREMTSQGGMLLPSYPSGNAVLSDGFAISENGEKVYRFDVVTSAMAATPEGACLSLPEGTGALARELLQSINVDMSGVEATAESIAAYVRESAMYNRRTSPMPTDGGDFALWFLESGDSGYCVHFATAAVVLLRSAGIPARYVTGYKVDAEAGANMRVTSDDAHAWAEYYNYKTWAWTILEATPGEQNPAPTEPATQATAPARQETVPTAMEPTVAQPAETMPQESEPERHPLPLWIPLTVFITVSAVGIAELQRALRIRLRQRRQRGGQNNRRALARWEEICLLCRLLGTPASENLEELAQKAMFSQHSLTKEELTSFASFAQSCRRKLTARPWYRRLLYRYWYAVL